MLRLLHELTRAICAWTLPSYNLIPTTPNDKYVKCVYKAIACEHIRAPCVHIQCISHFGVAIIMVYVSVLITITNDIDSTRFRIWDFDAMLQTTCDFKGTHFVLVQIIKSKTIGCLPLYLNEPLVYKTTQCTNTTQLLTSTPRNQ